jgi:glutaminyl-tRNA synthetase
MYDYAHGQSDSIEHVTHSMCSLEFADHQPLYKWFIAQLGIFPSEQIEFDRLSITYTLMSKRKLLQLVQEGRVNGWDDPRMPTLSGVRRRGYTPEAIRAFVATAGVSRTNGIVDIEMLEHFQRDDLNHRSRRAMAVLQPLKVIIDNYPEGQEEFVEVQNNPEDPEAGTRQVPFSRELYIEHDDFREVPPPKYYRLSPGKEVRLRNAYFITAKKSTVLMIRRAAAASRPTAARSNRPCTGSPPPTPSLPKSASTTSSSQSPIPTISRKVRTSSTISTPTRSKS